MKLPLFLIAFGWCILGELATAAEPKDTEFEANLKTAVENCISDFIAASDDHLTTGLSIERVELFRARFIGPIQEFPASLRTSYYSDWYLGSVKAFLNMESIDRIAKESTVRLRQVNAGLLSDFRESLAFMDQSGYTLKDAAEIQRELEAFGIDYQMYLLNQLQEKDLYVYRLYTIGDHSNLAEKWNANLYPEDLGSGIGDDLICLLLSHQLNHARKQAMQPSLEGLSSIFWSGKIAASLKKRNYDPILSSAKSFEVGQQETIIIRVSPEAFFTVAFMQAFDNFAGFEPTEPQLQLSSDRITITEEYFYKIEQKRCLIFVTD